MSIISFAIISLTLIVLAPVQWGILDAFTAIIGDTGISRAITNWNIYAQGLKAGYILMGVMFIFGIIIYLFLKAQKREYVTGGIY